MKRDICVFSMGGALTKLRIFFKKRFQVKMSSTPPPTGTMVTLGCLTVPNEWNRLKEGVVTNVRIMGHSTQQVWVGFEGTEMSTKDLQDCLTPAKGWQEIFGKLE